MQGFVIAALTTYAMPNPYPQYMTEAFWDHHQHAAYDGIGGQCRYSRAEPFLWFGRSQCPICRLNYASQLAECHAKSRKLNEAFGRHVLYGNLFRCGGARRVPNITEGITGESVM